MRLELQMAADDCRGLHTSRTAHACTRLKLERGFRSDFNVDTSLDPMPGHNRYLLKRILSLILASSGTSVSAAGLGRAGGCGMDGMSRSEDCCRKKLRLVPEWSWDANLSAFTLTLCTYLPF